MCWRRLYRSAGRGTAGSWRLNEEGRRRPKPIWYTPEVFQGQPTLVKVRVIAAGATMVLITTLGGALSLRRHLIAGAVLMFVIGCLFLMSTVFIVAVGLLLPKDQEDVPGKPNVSSDIQELWNRSQPTDNDSAN